MDYFEKAAKFVKDKLGQDVDLSKIDQEKLKREILEVANLAMAIPHEMMAGSYAGILVTQVGLEKAKKIVNAVIDFIPQASGEQ